MKMSVLNRILLLLTGLLAAYQVAVGIDGLAALPLTAYTIGFGVLIVACLLLVILGFEVLDSPLVVIAATIIPLSLALGLAWQYLPLYRTPYLFFAIIGFLAIVVTRGSTMPGRLPTTILALVHGVAGLTICLLPMFLAITGKTQTGFSLVGVGGAIIGVGGLLLSFLKVGKPILSREAIFKLLPGLLLLMTVAFVAGFSFS